MAAPPTQRGFTYLGVLLAVALMGLGLAAASEVWVMQARREKLEQLDWVGAQFVQAIGSYYESSPGAVKVFPASLQDLLEDRRFLVVRRHLREIYVNPMTGRPQWELLQAPDGRIRGVRALTNASQDIAARDYAYAPT